MSSVASDPTPFRGNDRLLYGIIAIRNGVRGIKNEYRDLRFSAFICGQDRFPRSFN